MIVGPNGRDPTVDRWADVSAGAPAEVRRRLHAAGACDMRHFSLAEAGLEAGFNRLKVSKTFGPKEAFLGAAANPVLDRFVERAERPTGARLAWTDC
jgi:hypothetical protein